jgi:poly(3-hydroxybutyrate) depolymerase
MKKMGVLKLGLAVALSAVVSNAFIVTGTVSNENGEKIKGADVTLINNNISTKTNDAGSFTLEYDPISIQVASNPGFVGVNNGVLSYAQSSSGPVQVQIFDALGFRVMDKNLYGSGSVDLRGFVKSEGTYFARIHMGSAQQNLKFTAKGSYEASLSNRASVLKKDGAGDDLRVIADGYDTLMVTLTNLDTNVILTLKKAEEVYSFGYALQNAPTPSLGCGKNSTLQATKSVENGQRFEMKVNGETRSFYMTLPKNYDNKKPYKVLFAMHCYGSNGEDFVHHTPDYDHPTPYYGQQVLDKENNYIFVSPDAVGGMWNKGRADHIFFDQMLTLIENNYCIDTSRVFLTGFSFGAMFSNSLAHYFQDRVRAVAVYAVADYNIWLPQDDHIEKKLPIAWMNVHGQKDGRCNYDRAKNSALVRILKNNGKADENGNFTDASAEKPQENEGNTGHVCYDFKTVDPRFPVKFCSWPGDHQWTAHDYGNMSVGWGWEQTWVPEEVHKFLEQF